MASLVYETEIGFAIAEKISIFVNTARERKPRGKTGRANDYGVFLLIPGEVKALRVHFEYEHKKHTVNLLPVDWAE